jgi:hypothetical protein
MTGQRVAKIILFCLLLLLSACAGRQALQTRVTAGADTRICSLAVMPFENWTTKPEADLLAYRLFNSALVSSDRFNVVSEGDVGLFRLRQRLLPGTLLHKSLYNALADQLAVDAVVLGRVVETGMDSRRGSDKVPFVALQVDLYDLRSDRLLLSTVHQRWGDEYRKIMHFGLVTTTSGVLQKMSQEIINDWKLKGVGCQ